MEKVAVKLKPSIELPPGYVWEAREGVQVAVDTEGQVYKLTEKTTSDGRPIFETESGGSTAQTVLNDIPSGNGVIELPSVTVKVEDGKFEYLFGQVSSNSHNLARSLQNKEQLARIGIHDTLEGRQIISDHLQLVVEDPTNVTNVFSKTVDGITQNFETRQSLLAGPGGFLRLDSTFEIMPD